VIAKPAHWFQHPEQSSVHNVARANARNLACIVDVVSSHAAHNAALCVNGENDSVAALNKHDAQLRQTFEQQKLAEL
jgi:hypothetical protein